MRLLHGVAERLEQPRGVGRRRDAVRMNLASRGRGHEADPQVPRIGAHLVGVRAPRGRCSVRITDARAADRIENGSGVADRSRHHVLADEPTHHVAEFRPEARPRPGRLQSDEPALARGDADRASAVVGVCGRNHAGRDGCSRPAARAPRRAVGRPRVTGRSESKRLGRRQDPELGRVGLPDEDEASSPEA